MKNLIFIVVLSFLSAINVKGQEVYTVVEEMPYFKGCITHENVEDKITCSDEWVTRLITQNVKYPDSLVAKEVTGKVYVSFIVDENGKVGNPAVLRGISGYPQLNQEAIRVISDLPDYFPGKQNGKLVQVKYVLPIEFKPSESIQIEEEPELFTIVEDMPIWKGCEGEGGKDEVQYCTNMRILSFISEKVEKYQLSKTSRIEKKQTSIRYVVDESGNVVTVVVLKSSGSVEEDKVAVNIIKELPEFIPAKQRGNPVRVQYTVTVKFK